MNEYYSEQSARFMDEAKVKLDYIELNLNSIKQSIDVSEEKLLERYDQSRDQLTTPELRTASHILLTVNDGNDDEIKAKIDALKTRLDEGEDFAALAGEFSQDPGSAKEGGDLGEVERGAMVKPFETALFELNVDQVSAPVKTQFGWHIIKLHEISGGETKSFEQARSEIEQELKADMAESQIYDLAENLASIGYEEPDSLLPAADQLDLKIQTTDWFTRSKGEGLAEQVKIREIAFSNDVLNQNRNSETIELSDNRIVIVHLNQHKESEKQSLDSVKDSIVTTLKKKAGRELAQTEGKKVLSSLQSGSETLDVSAGNLSLSIVDLGFISRSNTDVERDLLSTVFTLKKPVADKVVYEGVSEAGGDYTIIELSDVRIETEESAISEKDDPVKSLNSARANYEYQAVIKSLTEQA
ncbi:MAG: peptidylprolyl isomerase, partial [Gammaproteobacteria bacterium]|nr:peptidylprolyl isomerase [Gammaproteobacteria bacterium]